MYNNQSCKGVWCGWGVMFLDEFLPCSRRVRNGNYQLPLLFCLLSHTQNRLAQGLLRHIFKNQASQGLHALDLLALLVWLVRRC